MLSITQDTEQGRLGSSNISASNGGECASWNLLRKMMNAPSRGEVLNAMRYSAPDSPLRRGLRVRAGMTAFVKQTEKSRA